MSDCISSLFVKRISLLHANRVGSHQMQCYVPSVLGLYCLLNRRNEIRLHRRPSCTLIMHNRIFYLISWVGSFLMYWVSDNCISFVFVFCKISLFHTNSASPDQMQCSLPSVLGVYCLPNRRNEIKLNHRPSCRLIMHSRIFYHISWAGSFLILKDPDCISSGFVKLSLFHVISAGPDEIFRLPSFPPFSV